MSDLALDELIVILSDETNDKQLVALAELVRRASRAEDLAEALRALVDATEQFFDTGRDDLEGALDHARDALARYRGEK